MDIDPFTSLSQELRRHDPDRFVGTLWAPQAARDGLLALLAFALDLARLRDTVSQPLLARIRLQWWRDALAEIGQGQKPRRHPVLGILAPLLSAGRIDGTLLDQMIDARELDWAESLPADLDALDRYAGATGGALAEARAVLLGAGSEADRLAARHVGTGWALVGLIRAVPFHAAKGRVMIPASIVEDTGLDLHGLLAGADSLELRGAVAQLAAQAHGHLAEARASRQSVSRAALPVLAEARVAEAYLGRLRKLGFNVLNTRMAEPDPLAAWRLGWVRFSARY